MHVRWILAVCLLGIAPASIAQGARGVLSEGFSFDLVSAAKARPEPLVREILAGTDNFVQVDPVSAAYFQVKYRHGVNNLVIVRLSVTLLNRTNVVSLVQAQFDSDDLLGMSLKEGRQVHSDKHVYGTVGQKGTFLLFVRDLTPGDHLLYIKISPRHMRSSFEHLTYLLTLEEVPTNEGSAGVGVTTLIVIAMVVIAISLLLILYTENSVRERLAHRWRESTMTTSQFLEATRQATNELIRNIWQYFSMSTTYFVPALLFVTELFKQYSNGNQDLCAFNNMCLNMVGPFPVFNNIINSIGSILFGLVFMIFALFEFDNERICPSCRKARGVECPHYVICLLMGSSCICTAMASALYHTCPHVWTAGFDTAFMSNFSYMLIIFVHYKTHRRERFEWVLNVTSIYAHLALYAMYCLMCVTFARRTVLLVDLCCLALTTYWFLRDALTRVLSCEIVEQEEEKWDLIEFGPMLLITWFILFLCCLDIVALHHWFYYSVFCCGLHAIVYYAYYKIEHREALGLRPKLLFGAGAATYFLAVLLLIFAPTTDAPNGPWLSREYNGSCHFLGVFDLNDLWHVVSQAGQYLAMMGLLYADDGVEWRPPSSGGKGDVRLSTKSQKYYN